jgi:hypothetical protein
MELLSVVLLLKILVDAVDDRLMEGMRLLQNMLVSLVVVLQVEVLALFEAEISEIGITLIFALKIEGLYSVAAGYERGLEDDVPSGQVVLTIYHFMEVCQVANSLVLKDFHGKVKLLHWMGMVHQVLRVISSQNLDSEDIRVFV